MRQREAVRDARIRRQTIGNEFGELVVKRTRRAVRVTAITRPARWNGTPSAASFGFADLDDAAVDMPIHRLQAVRGGKRAVVKTGQGRAKIRAAMVRLLWSCVADDAACTCEPSDECSICQCTQALGLGKWRGARWAERVLPPIGR